MITQSQQVFHQALQLPPIERVELVERLLASFEFPARQTIDHVWAEEAESRIDAYERGAISAIPAGEVFANVGKEQIS